MLCKNCHEREVVALKWLLCKACYQKLYLKKQLNTVQVDSVAGTKIRLIQKYGEQFLTDLDDLNNKQFYTLKGIGDKYGLSRERIRQIYKKIYKRDYRQILTIKRLERKADLACVNNPKYKIAEYKKGSNVFKGAMAENMFFNQCLELGYDITYPCKNAKIDFYVNGFFVDVKSGTPFLHKRTKTKVITFNITEYQRKKSDFIACYNQTTNMFFIIPNRLFKTKSTVYINEFKSGYKSAKNSYYEFENAFHLLKKQEFDYADIGIAINDL